MTKIIIKVQLFWRLPYETQHCSKTDRLWVISDFKKGCQVVAKNPFLTMFFREKAKQQWKKFVNSSNYIFCKPTVWRFERWEHPNSFWWSWVQWDLEMFQTTSCKLIQGRFWMDFKTFSGVWSFALVNEYYTTTTSMVLLLYTSSPADKISGQFWRRIKNPETSDTIKWLK